MNRRRRNYLKDQRELESLLPHIGADKAEPVLDFLDNLDFDSELGFDQESFLLLLDQASGGPLSRQARRDLSLFITSRLAEGSKLRLVALIRDALRGNAILALLNPRAPLKIYGDKHIFSFFKS